MAGSLIVSMPAEKCGSGVGVSIGGDWYARIVDGARCFFPAGTEPYIELIYGAGDLSGEDWADLSELPAEGFNAFCYAIKKSIEREVRALFDEKGLPRPTPHGTSTDLEILAKLEADPRFDATAFAAT